MAGPIGGRVPSSMNKPAVPPENLDGSKFARDGSLKPGKTVDAPFEWRGHCRYSILGKTDAGDGDGADGGTDGVGGDVGDGATQQFSD